MSNSIKRREFFGKSCKAACLCASSGLAVGVIGSEAPATELDQSPDLPSVAYCGLYCGACPLYIMSVGESDPTKQKCLGCKSDKLADHCQECVIQDCAKEKRIATCGQCDAFPCEKTKGFHENMGPMGQVAERNSVMIQAGALTPLWSKLQQCRWTCEKCGEGYSIKDDNCPKCGTDVYSGSQESEHYSESKKS